MAKRPNKQNDTSEQVAEIDFLRIRGSNETVQDAIRALTERLRGPVQVFTSPPKALTGTGRSDSDETLFDGRDVIDVESVAVDDEPGSDTAEPQPRRRTRGEGANRDRNAGLAIVKELNLYPDGKESLEEFVAKKKPKTHEEHIAVFIYYLKNVLEEPNVGFSHIYSCFKKINRQMPADLAQICRNAESSKGWIDTSNADDLKRTTSGDNYVDHKLPHAGASEGDGAK